MYKFYAAVQENRAISCVSGEDMLSLFIKSTQLLNGAAKL